MSGVGLHAAVFLDEDGDLAVALIPQRLGKLSPLEIEARELFLSETADGTPEMMASMVERLAKLVPVDCADCGVATDVPGLVRELRKGAVVS